MNSGEANSLSTGLSEVSGHINAHSDSVIVANSGQRITFVNEWVSDASGYPVSDLTGTGLGLFIVKTLVAAHGGNISVKSKPGRRSRFTVKLPIEEAVSQAA